jgi:hypothetical protein
MKRLLFALAAVLIASSAFADVTVTSTISIVAAQMTADGTVVNSLKGTKYRSDVKIMTQDATVLIDTAAKQQWLINHATKEIQPFDPTQPVAGMPVTLGEPKAAVTANGQTKEILGHACKGYTVVVTMPMTIGSETLTVRFGGPVWLAAAGPAIAELKAAQKAMAAAGLSASIMGQGPQAKAMNEVTRALAGDGVPMEQELKMTIDGSGPMAQAVGQMGTMSVTTKVTAISSDQIADEKFVLPDGYTKK